MREISRRVEETKPWRFAATFFPPASEIAIEQCESTLAFQLPKSFREFVRFSNGVVFNMLVPVADVVVPSAYTINSLDEMVRFTQEFRREGVRDWDRFVHLGSHNEGDDLIFDVLHECDGENAIFDSGTFPYTGLDVHAAKSFCELLIGYLGSVESFGN